MVTNDCFLYLGYAFCAISAHANSTVGRIYNYQLRFAINAFIFQLQPGTDVMIFEIFSPKKISKNWCF
jgi:hypothetical protein